MCIIIRSYMYKVKEFLHKFAVSEHIIQYFTDPASALCNMMSKTKPPRITPRWLFLCLSVVDKLCELNGINNLTVLINTHIARSNFVDKDNFVVVVAEFKLDIPEVKTD